MDAVDKGVADDIAELEALFPPGVTVQIGPTLEWKILPMDLPRVAAFAGPLSMVMGQLKLAMVVETQLQEQAAAKHQAAVDAAQARGEVLEPFVGRDPALALVPVLVEFCGRYPAAFFQALAAAIGKPEKVVRKIPPAFLPQLLTVVVGINIDFFVQCLAHHASANGATTSTSRTKPSVQ